MLEQLEEYVIPKTVAEAVKLLRREPHGSAVAITGDIDFHWWRLQRAKRVIDTSRLGLAYLRPTAGALHLGAATLLEDIVTSRVCARFAGGLLVQGALGMVSPLKRNSTSLAALLINAVPTVDIVPALLALDAQVTVKGLKRRTIPLTELFFGKGLTILRSELLLEVALPKPAPALGTAIERQALTPSDKPILIAVATLVVAHGKIAHARLAVGGGVKVPVRFPKVEEQLVGEEPCPDLFSSCAASVAHAFHPIDDVRASADHRRAVAEVLFRRALARAAGMEAAR
jgi:CO/xanthine dehydrogenase FAD-binding subunit